MKSGITTPNPRSALDAVTVLGLHSGRCWPGASESECWAASQIGR